MQTLIEEYQDLKEDFNIALAGGDYMEIFIAMNDFCDICHEMLEAPGVQKWKIQNEMERVRADTFAALSADFRSDFFAYRANKLV